VVAEEMKKIEEMTYQQIIQDIEIYGCHLGFVEPDKCSAGYVYTVGLYKSFGHPEIVCFGLKTEVLGIIISNVKDLIIQEQHLIPNKLYGDFLDGYDMQFINVDKEHYPVYLSEMVSYYNSSDFPVLQLIWPDKQSNFPWDREFNPLWKFRQPLLDRNKDFKFFDDRNLEVYTTRQAFEGEPLLYAYHNEDGYWQFHCTTDPNIADAKLVQLKDIVSLDKSLNDLAMLKYGWKAWRTTKDEPWSIGPNKD